MTTVQRSGLSQDPFIDLIDAFLQDQVVHEYTTFEQLEHYCQRSANPVGRIVLTLFGESEHWQLIKSDSICTGLQLANFWQDVDRDLTKGRIYLPRIDRMRFGYTDDDLKSRRTTPQFVELMRFEVDRARSYLNAGASLVRCVPSRRLRLDLELFVGGGLKILDEIESIGYRVWDQRPTVTKAAKLRLLLKSAARALT
jgi:squalene synthase HpnC